MKLEIQSQDHIEVYASTVGYCCIRQLDPLAETDRIILISPNCVDQLCSFLQTAKEQAKLNRAAFIEQEDAE